MKHATKNRGHIIAMSRFVRVSCPPPDRCVKVQLQAETQSATRVDFIVACPLP